jgi:hypothetical protein
MKKKVTEKSAVGRVFGRVFALLGVTLLAVLLIVVGGIAILCKGPSPTARAAFVVAASKQKETAWIPHVFLEKEEVANILDQQETLPLTVIDEIFSFSSQKAE